MEASSAAKSDALSESSGDAAPSVMPSGEGAGGLIAVEGRCGDEPNSTPPPPPPALARDLASAVLSLASYRPKRGR